MSWRSIQFDWSYASILLLAVLPILWGFFYLYTYRKERLDAYASEQIRDVVVQERIPTVFWIKTFLFSLAWICGVIALMQPKGNERYINPGTQEISKSLQKGVMRQKMHTVIFLIDASASMAIIDAYGGKTREAVAKDIADDIISKLKGESVALYAFTAAAIQIVPSTMDYLFTRLMLRQIEINEGETAGTDIKNILETAKKRYFSTNSSSPKTIILLTDGGDTSLTGLKDQQLKDAIDVVASPLSDSEDKNVRLLAVGIGSQIASAVPGVSYEGRPVNSSVDIALLKKLSLAGRGNLWLANDMHPMLVSEEISKAIARDTTFVDVSTIAPIPEQGEGMRLYDYYYQIPLAVAIAALAACFLIPNARKEHAITRLINDLDSETA